MLVHARCAPAHKYTNPAERIMFVLNLGLQNCSLERVQCDEESESAPTAATAFPLTSNTPAGATGLLQAEGENLGGTI